MPGKPRIIVRNMPGGGGVLMARHLYTAARKDGTELGAAEGGLILNPLLGVNPDHLDMTKFGWLGSVSQDTAIAVVLARVGHQFDRRCQDARGHRRSDRGRRDDPGSGPHSPMRRSAPNSRMCSVTRARPK